MASKSEGSAISVLSWNVHGLKAKLNNEAKKERLLNIINEYDVVLLQETRIGPKDTNNAEDLGKIKDALKGHEIVNMEDREILIERKKLNQAMYLTYFSSRRRGVAIIINKPHTRLKALYRYGDYAWVHVEIDCQKYTFMSVYYHQIEQDDLMDSMSRDLREDSEAFKKSLIIGGDFNTTLNPDLDAENRNRTHATQRERLQKFMREGRLSDVWRERHPRQRQYTYSTREAKSRLDYIFMLHGELRNVQNCEINQNIDLSDHFPVTLTLETDIEVMTSQLSNTEL